MQKIAIFLPSRCPDVVSALETTGTGAREQIADWLANELAQDNEVHIFTNQANGSIHKGDLHYVPQEMAGIMLTTYEWDTLISFDFPSVAALPDIRDTVKRVVVSQNYFEIPPEGYDPEVFDLIDTWIYPSNYALKECSRVNDVDVDKGVVIPYCADPGYFYPGKKNDGPLRFIYANQAENGLAQMLRIWPEILANHPGAMLTVATPTDEFVEQVQWSHSIQSELALDIRDLIGQPNVRYIGRQGREALAKEFQSSDFLLYPAEPLTPSEIGSLPIIQAAASGCRPIFYGVDALPELYQEMGCWVPTDHEFVERAEMNIAEGHGIIIRDERKPEAIFDKWQQVLSC